MKLVLFLFLYSTSLFAQTSVLNAIGENNSQLIIGEILDDKMSTDTFDLLETEIARQNDIYEAMVFGSEEVCEEDGEGPEKVSIKKRRNGKVLKLKTVESQGYELVFLAEANTFRVPKESDFEVVTPTEQVKELYKNMSDAQSPEEMYAILENYINANGIRNLSLKEQAQFAAMLTGELPYSDERSKFQKEYNQGAISTFTQFTVDEDKFAGICGDIHAAHNDLVKRINPNLEAFTMSYAIDYSQHVISYVADPDDPDKIMMANYSRVEVKGTDGVSSLAPSNTGMDDVGERVRFFQYKDGKQDHVGTFRNDIGSLLYELSTDTFERGATPNDSRSSVQKIQQSWSKVVTKYKRKESENGEISEKFKRYTINNDLVMFRGVTSQGNEMVGILLKRQKLHNVDANGVLLEGEKSGSHGFMATTIGAVDYDRSNEMSAGYDWYDETNYFKVYFVTGKRYVRRIVEKKGFKFAGFIGHDLEIGVTADNSYVSQSDTSKGKAFGLNTGDGDYSTHVGFQMNQQLGDNNQLQLKSQLSNHIGLKNEPEIYSFSDQYYKKIKLTPNAFSSELTLKSNLPSGVLRNTASYVGTQMGGKAGYSIDYTGNRGGNIYVSMSTPTKGISSNKVNILPENYTVLTGGFTTRDLIQRNPNLDLRAKGNISYLPNYAAPGTPVYFQTGISLNFGR